jgi:hypothetical protein
VLIFVKLGSKAEQIVLVVWAHVLLLMETFVRRQPGGRWIGNRWLGGRWMGSRWRGRLDFVLLVCTDLSKSVGLREAGCWKKSQEDNYERQEFKN